MFRELDKSQSFSQMEFRILELWDKDDCFRKSVEQRPESRTFTFNDGPPFATGLPHYGHLLAGTIKDIIPRYWTMKGFRVERRFGWDCHGLPIESLVQDKLGLHTVKDIKAFGVAAFNEACRANVLLYTQEWRSTVRRMGRWVDFENEYKTMDLDFMESVWWVFRQCFDKGLIYMGHRILHYSPALATPLSNFEVNLGYKDVQDPSLTLVFPLEGEDAGLLVWTTTPWTLPSNLAIAVKPDIDYAQVLWQGNKYWLAEARVSAYFDDSAQVLQIRPGSDLVGMRYTPLFNFAPLMSKKQYSVFAADFVSAEDGTGAVHIAPSFGEEDFQLGSREDLGLFDPLDESGRFTSLVSDWAGLGAKEADKHIIQRLKADQRVFRHETLVHSYPHCWRTDVPLLQRAMKAWFLGVDKILTDGNGESKSLKEWMIQSNAQVNWVPDHIKNGRFGKWLEGARDWNLTRNRFWGTPIPIWLAEDGDMICVGSVAELEALTGTKVLDLHKHVVDALEIRTKDKKVHDADGKLYIRTPDVLDGWFDSGSMPYAQSHYPFENSKRFEAGFPADFIAEGLDQTRGWFYTLTVLAAALFQKPAFKNVIVNGIILAEDGQKMSKRLRNYPDPNELIESTSADAIRLFMINSAAVRAEELKFSELGVRNITRSVLLPLWNSLTLFVTYANADMAKGQLNWRPGEGAISQNELDLWIVSDLQELLEKIQIEMDAYRLHNVVPALVEFIDDLTNWYIRRSRRRFWKSENDKDKNSAYAALYHVLVEFSKVLAPFLPFLAEEMYQILVRETQPAEDRVPVSVHLCDFPAPDEALRSAALNRKMDLIRQAVNMGRALRAQHNIKNRQPLLTMSIVVRQEEQKKDVLSMEELIREELNVKILEVSLDESSLVTYKAKANFKTLGKRMGKSMKVVADKIASLDNAGVKALLDGVPWDLPEGQVTVEDILVLREVQEGLVVEAGADLTVALDITVTHDLRLEMLARECVSRIQGLRKEAKLDVTDHVAVAVYTRSDLLTEALEKHGSYIAEEVMASSFGVSDSQSAKAGEAMEIDSEIAVLSVIKKV